MTTATRIVYGPAGRSERQVEIERSVDGKYADITSSSAAPEAAALPVEIQRPYAQRRRLTIHAGDGATEGDESLVDDELPDSLCAGILDGRYHKEQRATLEVKNAQGKWHSTGGTVQYFAGRWLTTARLYRPVMSYAMTGLKWGVIVGVGLKLLDTTVLLARVNPEVLLVWLATLGIIFFPRFGLMGVIAVSIISARLGVGNLFLAVLAAGLVGVILGSLPGMFVGGLIGLVRRGRRRKAPDAADEGSYLALRAVIAPGLGAVAVWSLYLFWLNPLIFAWLQGR